MDKFPNRIQLRLEALTGVSGGIWQVDPGETPPGTPETPPWASTGRETASCVTITDYYNRNNGQHLATICRAADGAILWTEGRTPTKDVVFLDPPIQNTQPGRKTE